MRGFMSRAIGYAIAFGAHGGHYEDVYVKTDKGWRFRRREMIRMQSGPSAVPSPGPR